LRAEKKTVSARDTVNGNDHLEQRRSELNRMMMRLPMTERRTRWKQYLAQLANLTDTAGQ